MYVLSIEYTTFTISLVVVKTFKLQLLNEISYYTRDGAIRQIECVYPSQECIRLKIKSSTFNYLKAYFSIQNEYIRKDRCTRRQAI
jgi:hypothetical protein